jgi:hypothetical protein
MRVCEDYESRASLTVYIYSYKYEYILRIHSESVGGRTPDRKTKCSISYVLP